LLRSLRGAKSTFFDVFSLFFGGPKNRYKIPQKQGFFVILSKNRVTDSFFVFGHKKFFYDSKSSVMFQYGARKSAYDEKVEAMRDAEEDAGG